MSETTVGSTRLGVNINEETAGALREIADERGISITEAVRRLVGYGREVYRADRDGYRVLFKRGLLSERLVLLDGAAAREEW